MPLSKRELKLEIDMNSCDFEKGYMEEDFGSPQFMLHVTRIECPWICVIVVSIFLHSRSFLICYYEFEIMCYIN